MDPYWAKLLDTYATFPDSLRAGARWILAYKQMKREVGLETFEGELMPPAFDPPAITPQDFAGQYAQALAHMVSIDGTHAVLPKNFMENWRKAEEAQKD